MSESDKTPAPVGREVELEARVRELEDGIREAMNNLGVPQPGYPAPIAEAHRILLYALMGSICPSCDIGENTECVCPPAAIATEGKP